MPSTSTAVSGADLRLVINHEDNEAASQLTRLAAIYSGFSNAFHVPPVSTWP